MDELINKGELFVTDFSAFQGVPGKVTQGAQKVLIVSHSYGTALSIYKVYVAGS